jgi:hypothetical protein
VGVEEVDVAAKGGFRAGQTAKYRKGHRVQSLPFQDMAAVPYLMRSEILQILRTSAATKASLAVGVRTGAFSAINL